MLSLSLERDFAHIQTVSQPCFIAFYGHNCQGLHFCQKHSSYYILWLFLEESVTHSMLILEGFFTYSGKYSTWFLYDPAINVCKLSGIQTKLSFLGVVTITIRNVKTLSISSHAQRETMQCYGCNAICWAEHHLPWLYVKGCLKKNLLALILATWGGSAGFTPGAAAAEWSVVPSATRQWAALASLEATCLFRIHKRLSEVIISQHHSC